MSYQDRVKERLLISGLLLSAFAYALTTLAIDFAGHGPPARGPMGSHPQQVQSAPAAEEPYSPPEVVSAAP